MNIQWKIIPTTAFDDALQDWRAKSMTIKSNQKNSEEHVFPESLFDGEGKKKRYLVARL